MDCSYSAGNSLTFMQGSKRYSKFVAVVYTVKTIAGQLARALEKSGALVKMYPYSETLSQDLSVSEAGVVLIEDFVLQLDDAKMIDSLEKDHSFDNCVFYVYSTDEKSKYKIPESLNSRISRIDPPFNNGAVEGLLRQAFFQPNEVFLIGSKRSEALEIALSEMGYKVKLLSSCSSAFDKSIEQVPDFFIVEFSKDLEDPLHSISAIQKHEVFSGIPIVVAYQGRDVADIEKILSSGIEEVLLSPFASPLNLKKIEDRFPLPPEGRRLRALVVEDSPSISKVIASMFKKLGYDVKISENGFEGFKDIETWQPDIITSDYDMPILNGWEFCVEVRDNDRFKDIPIIMITTRNTELDRKKGDLLGVSAYLSKPFSLDKLKLSITEAIASAKTAREKEAIAKFVASDTLKAVTDMAQGGERASIGVEKFITVLFSDISKFSDKCEKFSARKIVKLLNTYFDLMVTVLSEHGAIIDKYIGDAIVARFDTGFPERDASNAIKAAWKMQESLQKFNEESFEEIQIRVGVNSGSVVMGNLGSSSHRLEYAMIGDSVNVGQRLESKAPINGTMISKATYDLAKSVALVSEMKEIQVKGKTAPVAAYILEGVQ